MPALVDQLPDLQTDIAVFVGGLDQKTPTLALKAGYAIARVASNYEAVATKGGGYARIGGYERFDGRAKPSDATYSIVQVASFTNTPVSGDVLEGDTSGATATVIATGANYIVITAITGSFTESEDLLVGATPIGTAVVRTVTISSKLNAQYLNLAADVYRALINAVPGSGPVRGVVAWVISGVLKRFAFRDNAGATACVLHQSSASGWTPVTMFREVAFTAGGATTPVDGATLTQGADTALIKRVVHESGSWAANTAAGRFIIEAPAPTPFAAGAATIGAINVTLSGADTAITLSPGGRYDFDVKNFGGQLTTLRCYGSDGVNKAFEFDGTVYVPLNTGSATDTPRRSRVHLMHLVLAIGSSLIMSGPGTPYKFGAADGGAEIATGDTVTGIVSLPGINAVATLLVQRRNSMGILFGSSASGSDLWRLVDFNNAVGGVDHSQQVINDCFFLDDSGVQTLRAAAELSGFTPATLTQHLQDFIDEKQGLLACSTVHKKKSQYRLFFSDGSGLWITMANNKVVGAMPITFPNALTCAWNCEDSNGEEVTYAGATSGGMVYQLDRGSSFDGEHIDARLTLAWDPKKSPRLIKSYRLASLEITSNFYAAIAFAHRVGYGRSEYAQPGQQNYETNFSGSSNWDEVSWDAFTWDGSTLSPTEVTMEGDGENVEITISSTTDYVYPYQLNSIITHFYPRRALR